MTTKLRKARKRTAKGRSLKRVVRARSPEYKEAWMAGARAGNDLSFELVFRALENLMKTLGIKRRKRPNAELSDRRTTNDYEYSKTSI